MNQVIRPGPVTNLELTLADTEYSMTLPAGCQHFSLQARTAVDIRFAFEEGKVAASTDPFMTLKAGGALSPPDKLGLAAGYETIYFASSVAGTVVEVMTWIK